MGKIVGKDELVDIGLVKPNSWNPKDRIEESEEVRRMYESIRDEIEKKGLFEAITVRKIEGGYEILDGYHRWRACKELGFEEIRINNLGKVDDKLARAITLIKEQKKVPLSELGVADIIGWYDEQGIGEDIVQDLLGYSEKEYKEYSSMFGFDVEDIGEDTGKRDNRREVKCPKCGHKFVI
jgi:ParB-like chromosome segregation protein Spo0J